MYLPQGKYKKNKTKKKKTLGQVFHGYVAVLFNYQHTSPKGSRRRGKGKATKNKN